MWYTRKQPYYSKLDPGTVAVYGEKQTKGQTTTYTVNISSPQTTGAALKFRTPTYVVQKIELHPGHDDVVHLKMKSGEGGPFLTWVAILMKKAIENSGLDKLQIESHNIKFKNMKCVRVSQPEETESQMFMHVDDKIELTCGLRGCIVNGTLSIMLDIWSITNHH